MRVPEKYKKEVLIHALCVARMRLGSAAFKKLGICSAMGDKKAEAIKEKLIPIYHELSDYIGEINTDAE